VAAIRDPSKETSQELLKLPMGPSSKVLLVKIDSKSETDAAAAVREVQ
jgi:norsolorinic acid ketoreductase